MGEISTSRLDWERYMVDGPHGSPLSEFVHAVTALVEDLERQQDGRVVAVNIDPTDTGQGGAVVTVQRGEKRPHPLNESSVSEEADWAI